jgi:hypothetical protein
MILNEKAVNCEVVDLAEYYNFDVDNVFIGKSLKKGLKRGWQVGKENYSL